MKTKIKYENVYSYDVKSTYPAALVHPDFKIPIKRGEFKNISKWFYDNLKKDKLQYGFYKCKIYKNNRNAKPFKNNFDDFITHKNDVYTHYDIYLAKKLGYTIELLDESIYPFIASSEPLNAFVYTTDKLINSQDVFNSLVQKLYKFKQNHKKNSQIKTLLSGLWGRVCNDKTYTKGKLKLIIMNV